MTAFLKILLVYKNDFMIESEIFKDYINAGKSARIAHNFKQKCKNQNFSQQSFHKIQTLSLFILRFLSNEFKKNTIKTIL